MSSDKIEDSSDKCSAENTKLIPGIKIQRKLTSGWTCSSVPKLRRNNVKLKFRPAVPVPVKDGDASIRIATDLPRFNWLELKLSQKQDSDVDPATCTQKDAIVPLKMRILRKASDLDTASVVFAATPRNSPRENHSTTTYKESTVKEANKSSSEMCSDPSQTRTQLHQRDNDSDGVVPAKQRSSTMDNLSTEAVVSCKWPLKKRAVRKENIQLDESSTTSTTSPPDVISLTKDDIQEKETAFSLATERRSDNIIHNERGPVIMKIVLPPTPPPSSSAATEALIDETAKVQEKPLDLSKPLMMTKDSRNQDMNNVPVIVMANGNDRLASSSPLVSHSTTICERPSVADLSPVHSVGNSAANRSLEALQASLDSFSPVKRYKMDSNGLDQAKVNDISFLPQTVIENRLPQRNGGRARIETNRPVVNFHRSIFEHGRTIRNIQNVKSIGDYNRIKDVLNPARVEVADQYRLPNLVIKQQPILVPALRPNTSAMEPRFPVHGLTNGHEATRMVDHQAEYGRLGVSVQRYFRPTPVSLSKTNSSRSPSSNQRLTSWVDWSPCCHVCSRSAGFRCAGCHRNAYCSVLCQAMDWPRHSQICQLKS